MFGLRFRDTLPTLITDELEALIAHLKVFLLKEHTEDGTHIASEWTDYSPLLALGTLGDGVLRGRYLQQGRIVFYDIYVEHGTTTDFGSGPVTLSLPVPGYAADPVPWITHQSMVGQVYASVNGSDYTGVALAGGPYVQPWSDDGSWTSARPDTWGQGDFMKLSGFYIVAA